MAVIDWNKLAGTVIEKKATDTLQYCRAALAEHTFLREDFKFQWPGAFHHARFLAKSLYILKLEMLSTQIYTLSEEEEMDQVVCLALCVGIYFGVWFFSVVCPVLHPTKKSQHLNRC